MTRSLCFAAAAVLFASLAAAAPPPAASPLADLAAVECAAPAAALEPAATAGLDSGRPEPLWLTHCNATQSCPNGSQVSCQGHSSCLVGSASVTCDGVTHHCSTQCSPPPGCFDEGSYCACVASGGDAGFCASQYCDCPFIGQSCV